MKKIRTSEQQRKKTDIYSERIDKNIPHKKFKFEIVRKLGKLATKIKLLLKHRFPKRIWPTGQENRKGPKF
ncbi:hypothetical protein KAT08_03130 [Candidatus Babeliales bacterium]|nr:hypothetical protein [Candidatus Babeliales bacterium]